jgi:hypothetical protein
MRENWSLLVDIGVLTVAIAVVAVVGDLLIGRWHGRR